MYKTIGSLLLLCGLMVTGAAQAAEDALQPIKVYLMAGTLDDLLCRVRREIISHAR